MKLFENFSKKRALKKAKQKYFKQKNKPMFFFTSFKGMNPKVKRGLKIGAIVAIPVAFLTVGASIGIYEHLNKDKIKEEVVLQKETITRRVYLLSKDNITVPLSVHLDKFNSVEEEIIEVFNLLKEDSKLNNDYFKGIVPKDTRILSIEIDEDGLLTMNLSEDFLTYKVSEKQIETSILYTMLQFDGIDRLSLEVEDKYHSDILSSDLGINMSSYNLSSIVNKELMTYYYQKSYGGTNYYIPKSLYVEKKEKDNLTFMEGVKYRLPGSEGLQKIALYSSLSNNQVASDSMTFEVKNTALVDENLVNNDLYNLLLLSMDIMGRNENVNFTLEGEAIEVDGIMSSEEYEVSSYVYNEVQI